MTDENSRPEFREWVDKQPQSTWRMLPLTHITKGLLAGDIVRKGRIEPTKLDSLFDSQTSFFFYGRPAYRVHGDDVIQNAATCPFLFIIDPLKISDSHCIHAFDTGAFERRMYSHVLMPEMNVDDFSLEGDAARPNKLLSAIYPSASDYFDGNKDKIKPASEITGHGDFLARAYIELITSPGRNGPDDRVGTIEVQFRDSISLNGNLLAVVVPDILWNDKDKVSWITDLLSMGVEVLTFPFLPGRRPEYYMHFMESEARKFYQSIDVI